jgi:hypothetical protein
MEELNILREKYINLSSNEIERLSTAEMLNITYEYNRKRVELMESIGGIRGFDRQSGGDK